MVIELTAVPRGEDVIMSPSPDRPGAALPDRYDRVGVAYAFKCHRTVAKAALVRTWLLTPLFQGLLDLRITAVALDHALICMLRYYDNCPKNRGVEMVVQFRSLLELLTPVRMLSGNCC